MLSMPYHVLAQRFARLEGLFDVEYRQARQYGHDRIKRWHSLEGLLSTGWQTWCGFCREVIVQSCNGTVTMSGVLVPTHADAPTAGRIGYVARQSLRNQNVKPVTSLQPHQEPTWGDPQIIIEANDAFKPANFNSIESGIKLPHLAPEHMRIVRNAVAHISAIGMSEVRSISVYYRGRPFNHPLDFLYWETKDTSESIFLVWLADLRTMAFQMCQ